MRIGELSKKTGASTRLLRYYEEKGIIHGERQENGYRDFGGDQVERVRTAQFYLGLGISTEMIGRIMSCQGTDVLPGKDGRCEGDLLELYRGRREEVEAQIETLAHASDTLQERIDLLEARIENTCPNTVVRSTG